MTSDLTGKTFDLTNVSGDIMMHEGVSASNAPWLLKGKNNSKPSALGVGQSTLTMLEGNGRPLPFRLTRKT